MNQQIQIRLLHPEADRPEWRRLRVLLWPDSADDFEQEADEITRNLDRQPVFVAVRPAGGLCGFVEVNTRDYADGCDTSPVGYIEGWFVDEDSRWQGIGRGLFSAAEAWARARGLTEMGSDTWLDNEVSHMAHLALGYAEVERIIHYRKKL